MSVREKWVRRFTVDDTAKHKNGFTIYKITSYLYQIDSPESVTVVSVWKRHSDIERLHKSMKSLHAGLHLRGTFPALVKRSFFKRFDPEVIDERARNIKVLLEFIADYQLLFTSTDFVKFLETGYPEPEEKQTGAINSIRTSLHLPLEQNTPLEYQSSDGEGDDSPLRHGSNLDESQDSRSIDNSTTTDHNFPEIDINDIKIESNKNLSTLNLADSIESLDSLESFNSDIYDELSKISIDKHKPLVKTKSVLPDLITFDEPSTSKFDDYHTMTQSGNTESDTTSLNSLSMHSEPKRSVSRVSISSKRSLNISELNYKTRTEDSYVFEAAQALNLAARFETMKDYRKAFEHYKVAIEKMLIGVESDTDAERRALIRNKTSKYLLHAEMLHNDHLCHSQDGNLLSIAADNRAAYSQLPIEMLRCSYEDLAHYKVIAIVGDTLMMVLHTVQNKCYVMKVIKKVPYNLTDFFENVSPKTRPLILPTNIPYMVALSNYIETENLVFLILDYAPGERLIDYISNYVKSVPNTPARELNLENVFTDPVINDKLTNKYIDFSTKDEVDNAVEININDMIVNDDGDKNDINYETMNISYETNYISNETRDIHGETRSMNHAINENELAARNNETNINLDEKTENFEEVNISVNELVLNSQRLLSNIDKTLNAVREKDEFIDKIEIEVVDKNSNSDLSNKNREKTLVFRNDESPSHLKLTPRSSTLIPPSAICKWAAEILTALESLHNCKVICRDLNPSNILLGNNGHVILTYFIGYESVEMALSLVQKRTVLGHSNLYVAPELYNITAVDSGYGGRVSDYWSYGAVLYELLCGLPLSYYHRSVFNSHTILCIPENVDVEARSLLTQLLTFDPAERLGAGKDGIDEIKQHPYFKQIDWQLIYDSWTARDSEVIGT